MKISKKEEVKNETRRSTLVNGEEYFIGIPDRSLANKLLDICGKSTTGT